MKNKIVSFLLFAGIIIIGNFVAFRIVHLPNQFQFVFLLALFMFYPILRFPLVGVYLMFLTLPFIPFLRRLYYLAYDRPKVDPLIMIGEIILAIMLLGLFFTLREHIHQGTFRYRIAFLVMAYFLYMLARTFVYNSLPAGMAILKFRFFGPQVLLFFVGMLYAFEEKHLKRLWGITIVIGVLAVCYGLKQLLFGYSEAEKIWYSSIDFSSLFIKGTVRPFSFFIAPATFADYLQLAIIGMIFFSSCSSFTGRSAWILMPLFWIGILITSVRSSWIGTALSIFIWLFIVRVRGFRQRLLFFAGIALIFMLFDVVQTAVQTGVNMGSFIATATGSERAGQNLNMLINERAVAVANPFQEYSFLSRVSLWRFIVESSADPQFALLGRGLGVLDADSMYMTYLAEFGYPGLLFLVAIIVVFIKSGFELIDRSRSTWMVAVAVATVTMDIVFSIIGITGSHIHSFPGDTYFWFWNGVMIGLWTSRVSQEKSLYETAPDA